MHKFLSNIIISNNVEKYKKKYILQTKMSGS